MMPPVMGSAWSILAVAAIKDEGAGGDDEQVLAVEMASRSVHVYGR